MWPVWIKLNTLRINVSTRYLVILDTQPINPIFVVITGKKHQTVIKVLIDELRTFVKYFECKQIKCSLLTKFLKGILELRD